MVDDFNPEELQAFKNSGTIFLIFLFSALVAWIVKQMFCDD